MRNVLLRAFAYLTDLILIISTQQHVILSLRVALTFLSSPSRAPHSSDAGVCAHIGTKRSHLLLIDPFTPELTEFKASQSNPSQSNYIF